MTFFECDKSKARSNFNKHSIKFSEAARAVKTGFSLTQQSTQSSDNGEKRFLSIAQRFDGSAVVMVWTPRNGNSRIISVRHARKKEKEALNEYLKTLQ